MTCVGGGLGDRLGAHRRDRVAYVTVLRRSSRYNLGATLLRTAAAVGVLVLTGLVARDLLAVLLSLPAVGCAALQLVEHHHDRDESLSRWWLVAAHQRSSRRTNGQQSMPLASWAEVVAGLLLLVIPAWVVTDAPSWLRLVLLGAGVAHHCSTALAVFTDHTWFNPDEEDVPAWHEVLRLFAGPLTAGLAAPLVLPAPWPPDAWPAVLVITLSPLLLVLPIRSHDLTLANLAPLVREEAHAGRELVISETHGALSTHLRLLEQEARRVRAEAPALYELAVSANARLRETLTLGQIGQDSSTSPASLAAPVLTLARAVGAQVRIDITVTALERPDRELARLVLSDLVGNALNAGAGVVGVSLAQDGQHLVIEVRDDAPAMPPGVWQGPGTSSARLADRLARRSGSLTARQDGGTKAVVARWAPLGGRG